MELEFYLFGQGEGVVRLHSNSQDPLVSIDDGVRDGGESGVANLQTDAGDVPHTLRKDKSTSTTG